MKRFANKVVWITGASSGIGAALAEAFAAEGAKLVLSARRRDELEQVVAKSGGEGHLVLPLDLAQPDTFPSLVEAVHQRFGRVDVLVHNGGISQRALVKDTRLDVDRRIMEVNYFGAVALTKAVLPSMLAAKAGHFVVVSSVMGKIGTPQRSAYAASKHALHGFFDCLRAEISADGLFVTLICPGFIRTEVSRNALTGDGSPMNKAEGDITGGHPAELTARQILDAAHARKSEVYVGALGKERLALLLKRFLPSTLENMVRKAVPK
ncbi:oxidoreductase, short-chain dehydrogenase/reductase family [Labilithrix luteola]|uniref:Oxidoreductase, short-chain dehydrogenase/reductase family n=1 Tax=Labilithrix luteola TaxID=1391654 RepID=A0A0K1PWF3_9BACT|nr:SDR family oxidoreductase [Labilithrix luteola]AKU97853.1 oxidoreductase, short-chain dehydrogenase/reductase family [Labilithrix luteola]